MKKLSAASRRIEIAKGAYLGLVDGSAIVSGEKIEPVALAVVESVLDGDRGWLGLLVGEDAPPLDGLIATIRDTHPEVDLELHEGGQPHYPLLIVAE